MNNTDLEYDIVFKEAKKLFADKMKDYGTSWRIMRLPSLTDQIFIKANRIRSLQESGVNLVGEGSRGEFIAIVNYGIIALIQSGIGCNAPEEMNPLEAEKLYDKYVKQTKDLMKKKNHDYGEAWRQMRISSMTDLILTKIKRLKQIEDNNGKTSVSEGVEGNYSDIVNYAVFCLILDNEQKEKQQRNNEK